MRFRGEVCGLFFFKENEEGLMILGTYPGEIIQPTMVVVVNIEGKT